LQVQEARGQHDDEAVKRAINEYEDALGRYIPVLMAQAKIYWELDMYQQVSKLRNYHVSLILTYWWLFIHCWECDLFCFFKVFITHHDYLHIL
jgi:hypothetical protein